MSVRNFIIGLERLKLSPEKTKNWGNCALLANQASLTNNFEPSWQVLKTILGERLKALFGPQHGFEATVQDNMIETSHGTHRYTSLPVYSLYSETREPTPEMLFGIDTIIIDIQITGCRIYTFKSTIAGCLRAAKKFGKKVVVLDRPNPINGKMIEGPILEPEMRSFVGQFEMPLRHGLTVGECARFFNSKIGADLTIIQLENWLPEAFFNELGRPWVITSPNIPTFDTVVVYPGTVIFEGTNISEGRGTALPFQFFGAPYIKDPQGLCKRIMDLYTGAEPFTKSGVFLRPTSFQPTSQKWAGQTCQGFQIHVLNAKKVRSVSLALAMLRAFIEMGGQDFQWKSPPYEYNYDTLPIKLIFGSASIVEKITDKGFSLKDPYWFRRLTDYAESIQQFHLYKRKISF